MTSDLVPKQLLSQPIETGNECKGLGREDHNTTKPTDGNPSLYRLITWEGTLPALCLISKTVPENLK